MGTQLFDRLGPRKVKLTEEGRTFYELVSPLLDGIETLKDRFQEAQGKAQKGSIRVATHSSVMVYLLPEAIKKFKMKFPECELSIVNRGKKDIVSMIQNGEADVGICSLTEVPANIEYEVFAKFKRLLITAKGHPLSKKSTITLKDIAQYPLIVPPQGSNTRTIIDQIFDQNGLKPKISMEVTGRAAIKTYVEMKMGISIINEFYIANEDKKKLFCKDISHYFGEAERGTLTRKEKYLTPTVKKFIDMIFAKLK